MCRPFHSRVFPKPFECLLLNVRIFNLTTFTEASNRWTCVLSNSHIPSSKTTSAQFPTGSKESGRRRRRMTPLQAAVIRKSGDRCLNPTDVSADASLRGCSLPSGLAEARTLRASGNMHTVNTSQAPASCAAGRHERPGNAGRHTKERGRITALKYSHA